MVQLVTEAQLASHLKRDLDLATAMLAIETASAWVESKTGMAFTARTATVKLPATAARELAIPMRPLRGVTAVSIGGTTFTDYEIADGVLWSARGWRTSWRPQQVQFTVEYGLTVTPDDIKGVVREAAGLIYDVPTGVLSEAIDDYRITYADGAGLSQMSLDTLAAYGADVGTVRLRAG